MNLKIGTFNIQHGINYPHYLETKESVIDLESCAKQIQKTGLDICALNEVYNEEAFGKVNQAKFIGDALGYHYYFARAIDISCGEYGNALVSKYPVKYAKIHPIAIKESERIRGNNYENRVLLYAVLDVDGTELSVYVCHFGLSPDEQKKAEEIIVPLIKNDKRPAIFMGDFNITPDNDIIKNLREFLFDSSSVVSGSALTFPSDVPTKQIDYIFANDKVRVLYSEVVEKSCSDHREYMAEIEI